MSSEIEPLTAIATQFAKMLPVNDF